MDAIRETVVQACIASISSQTPYSLQLRATAEDINANHQLIPVASSEQSFTSPKTENTWSHHPFDDRCKRPRIHHRARTHPYPMNNHVRRVPVSDSQVPWSYEWNQYKPTEFTSEKVLINPGADPGRCNLGRSSLSLIGSISLVRFQIFSNHPRRYRFISTGRTVRLIAAACIVHIRSVSPMAFRWIRSVGQVYKDGEFFCAGDRTSITISSFAVGNVTRMERFSCIHRTVNAFCKYSWKYRQLIMKQANLFSLVVCAWSAVDSLRSCKIAFDGSSSIQVQRTWSFLASATSLSSKEWSSTSKDHSPPWIVSSSRHRRHGKGRISMMLVIPIMHGSSYPLNISSTTISSSSRVFRTWTTSSWAI